MGGEHRPKTENTTSGVIRGEESNGGTASPSARPRMAALAVLVLALAVSLAACASGAGTNPSAGQGAGQQGSASQGGSGEPTGGQQGAGAQQGVMEPTVGQANFDPDFTHGLAKVDGGNIHYVKGGSGPPLVLIHGYPTTWWEWHKIMPELAENHTVIAVDLPGLGDSSTFESGYGHRNAAGLVRDAVQSLGYEEADVMAHDIGLWMAYRYAKDYPDEVNNLIVMEAPLPGFGPEITRDPTMPEVPLWHFSFHDLESDLPEKMIAGNENAYYSLYWDGYAEVKGAITPEDKAEYLSKYRPPARATAGLDYYRNINQAGRLNRSDAQPELDMPVLAIGGEGSSGSSWVGAFREVANDARVVVVPGAGHWITDERPEYLVDCVNGFLGDPSDGAPETGSAACATGS